MTSVVLVEDDPRQVRLYRLMLSTTGHNVIVVENAECLLAALQDDDACPALVVVDVDSLGEEAQVVLSSMRALHYQPPVLILTGRFPYSDARKLGAARSLRKPILVEDFFDTVNELAGPAPASRAPSGAK